MIIEKYKSRLYGQAQRWPIIFTVNQLEFIRAESVEKTTRPKKTLVKVV